MLLKNSLKIYSLSISLLTNIFIYFYFIVFLHERTIVCFYIISYTVYNYITTVYRSYGANHEVVLVPIAIRIEHIVAGTSVAIVHIARPEVRIILIRIDSRRSQPSQLCPYVHFCKRFLPSCCIF